jgi:hypothetical protein
MNVAGRHCHRAALVYLLDCNDGEDRAAHRSALVAKRANCFARLLDALDTNPALPSLAERERMLVWFTDAHRDAPPHRHWIPPPADMLHAAIHSDGDRAMRWVVAVGLPRYHPDVHLEGLVNDRMFLHAIYATPNHQHTYLPWLTAYLLTATEGRTDLLALLRAYEAEYPRQWS